MLRAIKNVFNISYKTVLLIKSVEVIKYKAANEIKGYPKVTKE